MPTASPNNSPKLGAYVPPKNWDDITADEKMERLREIIKNMNSSISRLQSDIHFLRESFKKHSHTEKEIVVPFNEYNNSNSIGMGASLSNEKYF